MSFGCNIADQHHCVQVADDRLFNLLTSLAQGYPALRLEDSVVLLLPSYGQEAGHPEREQRVEGQSVSLSMLLGFQEHKNIILVLEEGQCSIVDDLDFDRNISIIVCENAQLNLKFEIEQSCKLAINLYLQEYSKAEVNGIYRLKDKEEVEILAAQNHLKHSAKSTLLIKGVVEDQASISYKGNIFVAQDAYGSTVSQKNKTLILSPEAKAFSVPSMEVLNRDVQCAHGSAVAQIDEQQLFYLMSRGLTRKHATDMLIESFLKPTSF